jgi:hypothetical protein
MEQLRADMELSNGAEPLDELMAELDADEDEWADGGALFDSGGFANDVRKIMLSVVMLRIRDEILSKGERSPTEKVLDAMAHADKQYREWVDRQTLRKAEWMKLNSKRKRVEMRANRGQKMLSLGARFGS